MPLSPEARRARARLAAHRRWHPGEDPGALTEQCHRELDASAIDEHIKAIAARAPALTPEHAAQLRALLPLPALEATGAAHAST